MAKKLQKALAFVLLLSICMSLLSVTALSKVKDTSAEVSTVEQGTPQYPKEEVDDAVYAPPQDSKNKGTAKDPTVKTTTESKNDSHQIRRQRNKNRDE